MPSGTRGKGVKDDKKKSSRDKDRDREKDRDRKKDRGKDEERRSKRREEGEKDGKRDKERRHRDKENEGEEKHHRDRDKDREKRHRDRDKEKDRDKERRKEEEPSRDRRRHRDEKDDDERRRRKEKEGRRKERDGESDDKRKRHKEEDSDRRRRHRDEDGEGRRRRHRDEDKKEVDGKEERRQRRHGEADQGTEQKEHRRDETKEERRERKNREREEGREEKEKEEKKKAEKSKDEPQDDDGDYDYDDDFEDYDDDFEDDDGDEEDTEEKVSRHEMDEIMRAMNEENQKLLTESHRTHSDEEEDVRAAKQRPTTASQRTFINFVSAKQRKITQKASSKAKRRGQELLKLIDLDFVSFDMFDLPPAKDYEIYMRSFGRSDTKQAYIQTNDDNIDRDIQTEEIELKDKWSQHPPEDIVVCGGTEAEEIEKVESTSGKLVDTMRLGKFIQKAGQVMSVLLEEERSSKEVQEGVRRQKSNICVSEEFIELGTLPFLANRCVTTCHFSPIQTNILLTLYSSPKQSSPDDSLSSKGLICVWNVNEPSTPTKVLICESQPSCCYFSPTQPTLAFAGMRDGSVAVWDLREVSMMHKSHFENGLEFTLRYPTYNTAGVLQEENHQSAVVSLQPIVAPGDSALASVEAGSDIAGGTSFQLATLEESATVHLWVVAEITNPDPAGSMSDFGLSPGGKVKLIKSSTLLLENPLREARLRTTMKASSLQLLPSDPSHFYVGTDTGCIIHGVRYGGKAPPKAYRGETDTPIQVTAVDFSPFPEPVFLAGCEDGSLRLYNITSEMPLLTWPTATDGSPIRHVYWCRSRPSVFFVIDEASMLYIWDLLMNDAMPMKEEQISRERLTCFTLSNDHAATGLGTPGRKPQMVVCLEGGSIEVHTISQQFSALMPEEVDQFASLLSSVM